MCSELDYVLERNTTVNDMEIIKKKFETRGNEKGVLTFLEANRDIGFSIQRSYYIYNVAPGERRGFHAHKKLQQVLICIHGSCKVLLDDGKDSAIVELTDPAEGLFVGNAIWREMFDFSPGAVLLVLASEYYDEADYIRNYQDFLAYLEEKEK